MVTEFVSSILTATAFDPGELPGFWGSMVSRHAPIPLKGSGKQHCIVVHLIKALYSNFSCLLGTCASCAGDSKADFNTMICQHNREKLFHDWKIKIFDEKCTSS